MALRLLRSLRRTTDQFSNSWRDRIRAGVDAGGALTNHFPPLTHDPVGENKKVNAQRFELPSVHSGERRTNFPIRGEIGFGLALAQAAR